MDKLQLEFGGFSTKGAKEQNQDAFAAWPQNGVDEQSKGVVAAIADGVSSCARAQEAAITCVTNFINDYRQTPETWTVKRAASKVLQGLNRWCHGQIDYAEGGYSQMITTLSSVIFKSTTAFIFHTGDSRIYRWQGASLEQLTTDHHVWSGSNRVLNRAIGIEAHLEVDFSVHEVQRGDIYLLTTDGVHEFLSAKLLKFVLQDWQNNPIISLEALAKKIVNLALEAGSDDNLSCLLLHVKQLPLAEFSEVQRQLTRLALPPALETGMKLEGYRVLEILFNGTRSSLYKVIHDESGEVFCLKTPSQYFADDPIYLSGFLREEWIGQRVKHNNVMRIYARPQNAKFMFHLCEHIEGQTLRQWMLDNPKPSILQVRSILGQLVKALRALQRQDMVHRDVKPENIMITNVGEVKLIDFGTVWVAALAETNSLPVETMPLGSVNYIAPEYLLTQLSDNRSDLFSAAVVCYEMLSNTLPFNSNVNQNSIPSSLHEWQYISLRKRRADLPHWLDLALEKALQPNPKNRYQSYSEFLSDLSQPNINMLKAIQNQPLIERNPLLLYQIICVIQFMVIVLMLSL